MAAGGARPGFEIEVVRLTARSLPACAPALRFAHLSDLHLRSWGPRHERLVEAVNAQRPDFVFDTGDLKGRTSATWDTMRRLLSGLKPRHGIFACRGNWEADASMRVAELREMFAESGAVLLQNESRVVRTDSGTVRVCGVDDMALGWPDFEEATAEGGDADYSVLLSHAPLAARFVTQDMNVQLVLSGHTHAGQIRIPLLWRLAVPRCHGGFVAGLYRQPWGHVYVNRGYGAGGLIPVRFRCPSEVALFEVTPGA